MKFEKKNTKVPEGYSLNIDRKKWRLRIKKEGAWESLGRFDTEQAAVDFAVQAEKFAKQALAPTAAVVEKPAPETTPTPVADKKAFSLASPLERLRSAVRESPKEISAPPVAVDVVVEDKVVPAAPQPLPLSAASRTETLLLQSRVAQLQKDVIAMQESVRAVAEASKEVARIRENLRGIIEEKVAPLRVDIENLRLNAPSQIETSLRQGDVAQLRANVGRLEQDIEAVRVLAAQAQNTAIWAGSTNIPSEPDVDLEPETNPKALFWKAIAFALATPLVGGFLGFLIGYLVIKALGN